MKYCKSCKYLCDSVPCLICGSPDLCEVQNDDYCFLFECDTAFGETLEEIFENEAIPHAMVPSGNGVRSALGLNLENFKIFVPYEFYGQASEIINYFTSDSTEELKNDLLNNRSKWHIQGMFTEKKLKKKLNISKDGNLFSHCESIVSTAIKITDEGLISSCAEGGHYLNIIGENATLMFNSITYELLHAKAHK